MFWRLWRSEEFRICNATIGVTSSSAGLLIRYTTISLCSPTLEWGTIAPVLQYNAQHTGCAHVRTCCVTKWAH